MCSVVVRYYSLCYNLNVYSNTKELNNKKRTVAQLLVNWNDELNCVPNDFGCIDMCCDCKSSLINVSNVNEVLVNDYKMRYQNISEKMNNEEDKENKLQKEKEDDDDEYGDDFEDDDNYDHEKFEDFPEDEDNHKSNNNNKENEEQIEGSFSEYNDNSNDDNNNSISKKEDNIIINNYQSPQNKNLQDNNTPKFKTVKSNNQSSHSIDEDIPFEEPKVILSQNESISNNNQPNNNNNIPKNETHQIENVSNILSNKDITLSNSSQRKIVKENTVISNLSNFNPFEQIVNEIEQSELPSSNNTSKTQKVRSHKASKIKHKNKSINNNLFKQTNDDLIFNNYEQYAFSSMNHQLAPITLKSLNQSISSEQKKGYLIVRAFKHYYNKQKHHNNQFKLLFAWENKHKNKNKYLLYINKNEEDTPITNIQVRIYSSIHMRLYYQNVSLQTLLNEGIVGDNNVSGKQLLKYKKQLISKIENMFYY